MWRLKQLIPKEQSGLEGKTVEVGSLKLQVRSTIAQGGFSSVYLARDAQSGKQYALKHIICNDSELIDLVKKEVAVMRALKGHPNVVTLHAQSMYDMGRTKECFLVMEYCEKMMVNVLDSRNAGSYFEEKQLLLMFRDICNAVYAMHYQSPPIAHRDLKAENVLLGNDGQWKLCDFGSTSTNHKRFETADEMGIEEDIIRKHTTPAYRAPEMWDLYQRELISEKVDIWALGCLLYRIAYLKSAFDGESKLQILNGNYRLPDLPKFSTNITGLIKDMLNFSPEARPDVMQVWHRVNEPLPSDCRKASPDKAPSTPPSQLQTHDAHDSRKHKQSTIMPTRAPPLPPQRDSEHRTPSSILKESERRSPPLASKETDLHSSPNVGKSVAPLGAFWSTQYAQEAQHVYDGDDSVTVRDKVNDTGSRPEALSKSPDLHVSQGDASPLSERHSMKGNFLKKSGVTTLMRKVHDSLHQSGPWSQEEDGYEARVDDDVDDQGDLGPSTGISHKPLAEEIVSPPSDEAFSAFVAEFQNATQFRAENKSGGGESLQDELEKLRKELKQVQAEKMDIASKYEKLTAICRSQRTEIQELKLALAAGYNQSVTSQAKETPSQTRPTSSQLAQAHAIQQRQSPTSLGWQSSEQKSEKQAGSIWDLQEGLSFNTSQRNLTSETQGWRAFGEQDCTSGSESLDNAKFGAPRFDGSKIGTTNGTSKRQSRSRAASFAVGDAWGLPTTSHGAGFEGTKGIGQRAQDEGAISSTAAHNAKSSKVESGNSRPSNRTQPSGWAGF